MTFCQMILLSRSLPIECLAIVLQRMFFLNTFTVIDFARFSITQSQKSKEKRKKEMLKLPEMIVEWCALSGMLNEQKSHSNGTHATIHHSIQRFLLLLPVNSGKFKWRFKKVDKFDSIYLLNQRIYLITKHSYY